MKKEIYEDSLVRLNSMTENCNIEALYSACFVNGNEVTEIK